MNRALIITILIILNIQLTVAQNYDSYFESKKKGDSLLSAKEFVKAYEVYDNTVTKLAYGQLLIIECKNTITSIIDSLIIDLQAQEETDSVGIQFLYKTQDDIETIAFNNALKSETNNEKYTDKLLKNLDTLDLSDKCLRYLPIETKKCIKLKSINLLGNPDLDWEQTFKILDKLKNLNEIKISTYNVSSIPYKYLKKISGIKLLKTGNKIPDEIFNLKKLTYLDISDNRFYIDTIFQLPLTLFELKELRMLNLSFCYIQTLPAEIENLDNLEYLYLDFNKITDLPSEIGNLKNLSVLNLNNNRLKELPPEIGKLSKLTELDLSSGDGSRDCVELSELVPGYYDYMPFGLRVSNLIAVLPDEFIMLTNLKKLNLTGNQISHLPEGIGKLNNLTELYIGDNNLQELPPEIEQLKNLTVLDLYKNNLHGLPDEIGNLQNLEKLYLDCNELKSFIPKKGDFINLKELTLSGNKLTLLPTEIRFLTNLIYLDLYNTTLSEREIEKIRELLPDCNINLRITF